VREPHLVPQEPPQLEGGRGPEPDPAGEALERLDGEQVLPEPRDEALGELLGLQLDPLASWRALAI
jgi:hypothetical protein